VEGAPDLPAVGCVAALGGGVIGAVQAGDVAVVIGFPAGAGDEIRALEANFIAGEEPEIFLRRLNHEVVALDEYLP